MKRLIPVVLICFLCAPALVPQTKDAQSKSVTGADDRIYDEVRRRLADDPDVKGGAIDVTVTHGAVTIKGRVHDIPAKEKATKIVKKVKGVTTVENQLKLFSDE